MLPGCQARLGAGLQLEHDTMVARADAVVEHVRSGDTSLRLKAVREMKNQVVGSRSRKLQFLKAGAVPHLVAILATDGLDPSLIVQVGVHAVTATTRPAFILAHAVAAESAES
jgi:hypothetical protein